MTQEELAEALGVHLQTSSTGSAQPIAHPQIVRLALDQLLARRSPGPRR